MSAEEVAALAMAVANLFLLLENDEDRLVQGDENEDDEAFLAPYINMPRLPLNRLDLDRIPQQD
ncbi:hypothetical protein BGX20_004835, partial [Mortierella sp. AD010]